MISSPLAHGRVTPIILFHSSYLEKSLVKARTKADDIRAMQYLAQWCEKEKVPQTLQAIDRKTAARFMDQLGALCGGLAARTQNKYLGRLSRYWAFMLKREHVATNPWQGLMVEVPITKHDEEERAFKDAEVRALLMGGAEPRLMDLMLIGALTGARLDAIVDLRVKDVANGAFTFKPQKKERTPRDVPIHAALASIVTRRTAGRSGEDPFFPEWPAPTKEGSLRERSFKASNRFTSYRRAWWSRRGRCRQAASPCQFPLFPALVHHEGGADEERYRFGRSHRRAQAFGDDPGSVLRRPRLGSGSAMCRLCQAASPRRCSYRRSSVSHAAPSRSLRAAADAVERRDGLAARCLRELEGHAGFEIIPEF